MRTELLNLKRWKTRIELANGILDNIEISNNRQHRDSAIGMFTPVEYKEVTTNDPTHDKIQQSDPTQPGMRHQRQRNVRRVQWF